VDEFGDSDFSPYAIQKRAEEGYAQTMKALRVSVVSSTPRSSHC
jgi:hypothetical protein